jgi:hypothetical protein
MIALLGNGQPLAQILAKHALAEPQIRPDGFSVSEVAFRLDQNSPNRAHELISGVCQAFEILRCFVLLRSGKGFVEVL